MKTVTKIRSIVAIIVIFFAAFSTSCNKAENITPTPPTPQGPQIPETPAVSLKPSTIITTENGVATRKQFYQYDNQGNLLKYLSVDVNNGFDSVLLRSNNVSFKTSETNEIAQSLTLNNSRTFKSLFSGTTQIDFINNGNNLSSMQRIRQGNTPLNVGAFTYSGNNLSVIGAEIRIDINYHQNLPYQKGINEIPVALKPIKFYKIMEMENATSTFLYNKFIRQVIIDFGNRKELHSYSYTFDENNRVTEIRDVQTITTSTSSSQKTVISNISYN
ncbi:MAG: hypothetical protein KDD21_01700 [Bacteroidetes bacterium]|nr:hypothetical protein [Bacteroidota bacterium]